MDLISYLKILKDEEIARRYFVMNSFDGALTILGIVIAMYVTGVHEESVIIISSLGATIAMTVSGIWGAYSIEKAERIRTLKELERHLLCDLDETHIEKKVNIVTVLVALVDGLSPLLVSLIIISPFFASKLGLMNLATAFMASMTAIIIILFLLGALVGYVAKESMIKNGIRMLLAGFAVGCIVLVLEYLKFL